MDIFKYSGLFLCAYLLFFDILQLAEDGFYLVGISSHPQLRPDLVRCYYCRTSLDCWETTDIPRDEHNISLEEKGANEYCPFIDLGKSYQDLTSDDVDHLEQERKKIIMVLTFFHHYTVDQKILQSQINQFHEKIFLAKFHIWPFQK